MGRKHEETLEMVREAIDQIRRGDIADGLTTLERAAYPKWHSLSVSRSAYQAAIGEAAGKPAATPTAAVPA